VRGGGCVGRGGGGRVDGLVDGRARGWAGVVPEPKTVEERQFQEQMQACPRRMSSGSVAQVAQL
jgi:hypothetical protein